MAHELPVGVAVNLASSAAWLAEHASTYASEQTDSNRIELVASMRIMQHRLDAAMQYINPGARSL